MKMSEKSFERIAKRFQNNTQLTPRNKGICAEATEFKQRIESSIFSMLVDRTSNEQVMYAKYLLQEEWHSWRKGLPEFHPRSTIPGLKHPCIDDIYFELYERLRSIGMRIQINALAPKPSPPNLPTLTIPPGFDLDVSPEDVFGKTD
jgi:hypothetical protein